MNRRDVLKSAAVASAGAAAGFGGLAQVSRMATAAGSNRFGAWSSALGLPLSQCAWPLIPIHAVMLGDGRLLTYGTSRSGQQTGYYDYDIWDPGAGLTSGHLTMRNMTQTDIFCSAQLVLPQSGKVFVAGGDNWTGTSTTNTGNINTSIFNPGDNSLTRSGNMNRWRWYATPTTLPDGRIYLQGGTGDESHQGGWDYPEVRNLDGTFSLLTGAPTSSLFTLYPRNWVAPNGRIFGYSDRSMYYVNPDGSGSITMAGTMPADGPSGWTSTDVMYAPGKIMRTGGGSTALPEQGGGTVQAKNAAAVIDINGAAPVYKKMPSMPVSLHWANATVMADGNVVVTGGSQLDNQMTGMNTTALLWKADTGNWTQGAQSTPDVSRLYHSVALLLPDGSVFSGGGGAPGPQPPSVTQNAEIYYPPYLFTNSGAWAPRPAITSAPATVGYGKSFTVGVNPASGIQRVTLIKAPSVTHSFNFEQRFMALSFTAANGSLNIQSPANAFQATPGNYMLFVFNSQGVPSVARIIGIG